MNTPIRIAAVIVLYKESLQDSVTYQSLLASANIPFLVYDNSQNPEAHQANRDFETYHNSDNPGVSAAYNFAWNWAVKNEFSHLLLLDSDSNFPKNAIEVYPNPSVGGIFYLQYPEELVRTKSLVVYDLFGKNLIV